MLAAVDSQRPAKFYLYGPRAQLERCLTLGEFPLQAWQPQAGSDQILPFRPKAPQASGAPGYMTLCLTTVWDEQLFDSFPGADCCLVIHQTEGFGERLHQAVQRLLPNWAGIDAAIAYGRASPLGAAFSRPKTGAEKKEWLFAWRPIQATPALQSIMVQLGSLEAIAELRAKNA